MNSIDIGGRLIGHGQRCFIIAEAGVNHNGDVELGKQLIDIAANAGADAVKFQTFESKKVVSHISPKAQYQMMSTGSKESQLDMVRRLELHPPAFFELNSHCQKRGILFLSTPFDYGSADLLEELGVLAYKISSGEITNEPFVSYVANKGKPLIVSTGMSDLGEVESIVQEIEATGNRDLVLLHCVSNYPADPSDANLLAMKTLQTAFGYPVGFSDHTMGIAVALASVALGACVLEKHFTLDRSLPGPDHQASLEPRELEQLVMGIREVEIALGTGRKRPTAGETDTAAVARRSLVAAYDLAEGSILKREMVAIRRPGNGLPVALLPYLLGRTLTSTVAEGELLTLEILR